MYLIKSEFIYTEVKYNDTGALISPKDNSQGINKVLSNLICNYAFISSILGQVFTIVRVRCTSVCLNYIKTEIRIGI